MVKRARKFDLKRQDGVGFGGLKAGLIVNADDFGVHPAINDGILSAYRNGIVSSVSLMVMMPLLDETCRNLKASGVPAGLHLCCPTQGQAVAKLSSVSDLVDEAGNFRHSALNLLLLRTGTVDRGNLLRQIEEEFSARARARQGSRYRSYAC